MKIVVLNHETVKFSDGKESIKCQVMDLSNNATETLYLTPDRAQNAGIENQHVYELTLEGFMKRRVVSIVPTGETVDFNPTN